MELNLGTILFIAIVCSFIMWILVWIRTCWKKGIKSFIAGFFVGILEPLYVGTFVSIVISLTMVFTDFFYIINKENIILPESVYDIIQWSSLALLIFSLISILYLKKQLANWILNLKW